MEAESAITAPERLDALEQQLNAMREWLTQEEIEEEEEIPSEQPPPGTELPSPGTGEPDPGLAPVLPEPGPPQRIDLDFLRHGVTIDQLAGDADARMNELIREGERLIAGGEYFAAERQFIRSLRFRPGHPLAMAGLAHAQIGAGVHVSAALTLRQLFIYNPEMIDARYAADLLPSGERLAVAAAKLRERVQAGAAGSGAGLVLAYIGRQTADEGMIREGIDAMLAADDRDPLATALSQVWLEGARPDGDTGGQDPPEG
jgi:hypothetical protein